MSAPPSPPERDLAVDLVHVDVLLLDLDDTLYDYVPAERAAREHVLAAVARELDLPRPVIDRAWTASREAVKHRLGERGASHSRLLYLMDLVHRVGRAQRGLPRVRAWNAAYWGELLRVAELRAGVLPLLRAFRARGGRVAIVTDLVVDVQLDKLERFALVPYVDAVVVSEEVPLDKPSPDVLVLAMDRLGNVERGRCVVVGDSARKDGGAAAALGLRYVQIASSDGGPGESLERLAERLGLAS